MYVQLTGLFPEWVSMRVLRFPVVVPEYLHCLQLKGFLPEWVKMCVLKLPACVQKYLLTYLCAAQKVSLLNGLAMLTHSGEKLT